MVTNKYQHFLKLLQYHLNTHFANILYRFLLRKNGFGHLFLSNFHFHRQFFSRSL